MAGRLPKGVYSRPTLDWYYQKAATGLTVSVGGLPNQFNYGGLFNNAVDGRSLFVLDITGSDLGSDFMLLYRTPGVSGAFVMNGRSLDPRMPTVPGQIYLDGQVAPKTDAIAIAAPQFVAATAPPSGFRCVVPPGYTLWYGGTAASVSLGVCFTWVALTA